MRIPFKRRRRRWVGEGRAGEVVEVVRWWLSSLRAGIPLLRSYVWMYCMFFAPLKLLRYPSTDKAELGAESRRRTDFLDCTKSCTFVVCKRPEVSSFQFPVSSFQFPSTKYSLLACLALPQSLHSHLCLAASGKASAFHLPVSSSTSVRLSIESQPSLHSHAFLQGKGWK